MLFLLTFLAFRFKVYTIKNFKNIYIKKVDDLSNHSFAGKKLADGKQLTGKGRPTNKLINNFPLWHGNTKKQR